VKQVVGWVDGRQEHPLLERLCMPSTHHIKTIFSWRDTDINPASFVNPPYNTYRRRI
jgi:hypothetical protein